MCLFLTTENTEDPEVRCYDAPMQSPKVGKQKSAGGAGSLSKALPRLNLPRSAAPAISRPKPQIGKPGAKKG